VAPRVVAIDWSGAAAHAERTIWLAEVQDQQLTLANGRDRTAVVDYLLTLAQREPALVVGFDFSFSLPAWFLAERGLASAPELWADAAQHAETWLRDCPPPFWGRAGTHRPIGRSLFRQTELDVQSVAGIRPKSTFQIGGAGAVGTGSLRGWPTLARLRQHGFAVWPFDAPTIPLVVEIYPRLLTGRVVKSNPLHRAEYLAQHYPALPPDRQQLAASTEDAFDAAVSALVMADHRAAFPCLPTGLGAPYAAEGCIWRPASVPAPAVIT
jgi:hypothetical protein